MINISSESSFIDINQPEEYAGPPPPSPPQIFNIDCYKAFHQRHLRGALDSPLSTRALVLLLTTYQIVLTDVTPFPHSDINFNFENLSTLETSIKKFQKPQYMKTEHLFE